MSERQIKIIGPSVGVGLSVHHSGEVLTVSEAIAESWVHNKLAVYEPPLVETPEDKLPNLENPEGDVPPVDNPEDELPDVETPEDKPADVQTKSKRAPKQSK